MWAYLLFLAFSSTVTVSAIPTFDAKSGPGPVFSKRQNGELPGTCPSPANVKRQDKYNSCPPKNVLDAKGDCPLTFGNQCTSFCQISWSWDYGMEVSSDSYCAKTDDKCTTTSTLSFSVENQFSFNVGGTLGKRDDDEKEPGLEAIKFAFNAGATWTYSTTNTTAVAEQVSKPTNAMGVCGYWTFIPYYVTTCGSLTTGEAYSNPPNVQAGPGDQETNGCRNIKTTGNFCQTQPWLDPKSGNPGGLTTFVATSCQDHWNLGFCKQQQEYLLPGVSNNASVYQDYVVSHINEDITQPLLSTTELWCNESQRMFNTGDPDANM